MNQECDIDYGSKIPNSTIIYGYKGSTAEEYAENCGNKFVALDGSTAKLSAPAVKLTVNTNGSFKISWNKVAGADKYEIYVDNGSGYKLFQTVTGTNITYTGGSGTVYYKVKAIESKAVSDFSNVVIGSKTDETYSYNSIETGPVDTDYGIVYGAAVIKESTGTGSEIVLLSILYTGDAPYLVTGIESWAFAYVSTLKKVTLPENIANIGMNAFSNCNNLQQVIIKNKDCTMPECANAIPSNATIYGFKGSTAEQYAKTYGKKFVALAG